MVRIFLSVKNERCSGPIPNTPLGHLNSFIDTLAEGRQLDKFNLDKTVGNWRIIENRYSGSG